MNIGENKQLMYIPKSHESREKDHQGKKKRSHLQGNQTSGTLLKHYSGNMTAFGQLRNIFLFQ